MAARPDDEDTRPPGVAGAGGGGVGPGGFGAWGKMPALGDFFHLRLGRGFVDGWDRFVQGALVAGRAALGGRWNDCYLTAPIWRFTLAPGLAGPDPVIGVMMASIDRVGRQFPLTLAAPLPAGGSVLRSHFLATPAFVTLEGVALAALDEGMTREALAEALWPVEVRGTSAGAVLARGPAGSGNGSGNGGGGALVAVGGGSAGLAIDLAAGLAEAGFRAPSVWSADVAGGPRLMICEGLPGAAEAAGLFDLDAPVWRGEGARGGGAGRAASPAAPLPAAPAPAFTRAPARAPDPGEATLRPAATPAAAATAAAPPRAAPPPPDDDDIMAAILADPGPDATLPGATLPGGAAAAPGLAPSLAPDPKAGADLLAELLAPDDDPDDDPDDGPAGDASGDTPDDGNGGGPDAPRKDAAR